MPSRLCNTASLFCALAFPITSAALAEDIPNAVFTDITASAGIRFTHVTGASGEKLLPETMGGGVAFFDYNNDGRPDLLFVNSCHWPGKVPASSPQPTSALYRNLGAGRFEEVSQSTGLNIASYGMGAATGDYDNDGFVDVFVTSVGGGRLFHNEQGRKFIEVTATAGVAGSPEDWSTSAGFLDYNNDGRLDLFVCNYIRWSRELDMAAPYELPRIGRAYGPPRNFQGVFPRLYRNDGNGRFTDVSAQAGVQISDPATGRPMAKSLALSPVDADNDGWIDIVVANDTVPNFLLHNERNGTFKEIGARSGIAYDAYGLVRGAMGIDSARFRNDDALGIAIGNFANEMNALYVAQRDSLMFVDEALKEGMGPASQQLLKFGLFFFDYDLDGRLDVLTANGHLEPEIARVHPTQQYKQPAQLFWNRGGARGLGFMPVPPEKCGRDLFKPIVGRGSAFADIDGDGDLDVVLAQAGGPSLLLRNDQSLGNRWVRLKLVGTASNRDGIGAWVKLRAGGHTYSRQVMPVRSYLSQSELPVTIGIGKNERVDALEITWPGRAVQKVDTGGGRQFINQMTEVREPGSGALAPR